MLSSNKISTLLILTGLILLLFSLFYLLKVYYPIFIIEKKYVEKKPIGQTKKVAKIVSNFTIIIPKLKITSIVFANIDPYNKTEYQSVLQKGIAHAKGTALPGEKGNIFVFAHSSTTQKANQYNVIFYLLGKLEKNEQIMLEYQNKKYHYKVIEKKIVKPSEVDYLKGQSNEETLTLMTCWPPGTIFKRLLVFAKRNT